MHIVGAFEENERFKTKESQYQQGSPMDGEDEYMHLVGAIIRLGLEYEGPAYLRTQDGQFWCWLGGIEPAIAWDRAVRNELGSGAMIQPAEYNN